MSKRVKDFTDEEKAAIIARLQRVEPFRVAKEFDTTWQTVAAIGKAANKMTARRVRGTKAAAKNAVKEARRIKKLKTLQKREEILARAAEIGVTRAAEEAGISKWTIFQWRKQMKKAGIPVEPIKHVKVSGRSGEKGRNVKKGKGSAAASKATVSTELKAGKKVSRVSVGKLVRDNSVNISLEFENAKLRDRVAALTEQVEKLRAAIAKLA